MMDGHHHAQEVGHNGQIVQVLVVALLQQQAQTNDAN
jgi:hypothetical protein